MEKQIINGLKMLQTKIKYNKFILLVILTFLIPIATSGNFFNNWLSIFLFLYFVFLINNNKNILFDENISN